MQPSRVAIAAVAILSALLLAVPVSAQAPAEEREVPEVLMFSGTYGFRHSSIEHSVAVITGLAESTGAFTVTHTEDPAVFTPERLAATDIILFANTTGETPFTDVQKQDIEAWVLAGGGFMGLHSAADTNYQWPFYQELVGAAFDSHPHTGNTFVFVPVDELDQATVQVETPGHPINADQQGSSFPLKEEFYRWREDPRGTQDVQVLLSLDEDDTYGLGNPPSAGPLSSAYVDDQPLEWVKTYRNTGRVWYSNLGHYDATYDRVDFRNRFVNAVEWVHSGPHIVSSPPPAPPASSGMTAQFIAPVAAVNVGFVPPVIVMTQGTTGTLTNLDAVEHNINSRAMTPSRKPLFASAFAAPTGGQVPVKGVEALPPGTYDYFCTIHGSMTGQVVVV